MERVRSPVVWAWERRSARWSAPTSDRWRASAGAGFGHCGVGSSSVPDGLWWAVPTPPGRWLASGIRSSATCAAMRSPGRVSHRPLSEVSVRRPRTVPRPSPHPRSYRLPLQPHETPGRRRPRVKTGGSGAVTDATPGAQRCRSHGSTVPTHPSALFVLEDGYWRLRIWETHRGALRSERLGTVLDARGGNDRVS